jgi:hypothetical protein
MGLPRPIVCAFAHMSLCNRAATVVELCSAEASASFIRKI